ncbi:hypothetical protein [Haloarchaeobius sp. FL176]|uniref:hypothetical protein n=1 Tax=Haloarchaeobius sp. FL176 TaxID=2967129 RepID=UPI0021488027|nr:hypothetical protein [Haloarchaeobius sp. FL176]
MKKPELYRATTLWFVALIAVQTAPTGLDGPIITAHAIATVLVYLMPLYVVVSLFSRWLSVALSD